MEGYLAKKSLFVSRFWFAKIKFFRCVGIKIKIFFQYFLKTSELFYGQEFSNSDFVRIVRFLSSLFSGQNQNFRRVRYKFDL